jgi:hypothetical protein
VVPTSRTPRVYPVTGTGEPGTGIDNWARAEMKNTPPTIKTALLSALARGRTRALSDVAGNDICETSRVG